VVAAGEGCGYYRAPCGLLNFRAAALRISSRSEFEPAPTSRESWDLGKNYSSERYGKNSSDLR